VELNAFEYLETIEGVFCFVTPETTRVIYMSVVMPHMEKIASPSLCSGQRSQISLLNDNKYGIHLVGFGKGSAASGFGVF
jgi:hypothetical protein